MVCAFYVHVCTIDESVLKSHLIAKNRKYHEQKKSELNWEGGTEDEGFNIYINMISTHLDV